MRDEELNRLLDLANDSFVEHPDLVRIADHRFVVEYECLKGRFIFFGGYSRDVNELALKTMKNRKSEYYYETHKVLCQLVLHPQVRTVKSFEVALSFCARKAFTKIMTPIYLDYAQAGLRGSPLSYS